MPAMMTDIQIKLKLRSINPFLAAATENPVLSYLLISYIRPSSSRFTREFTISLRLKKISKSHIKTLLYYKNLILYIH